MTKKHYICIENHYFSSIMKQIEIINAQWVSIDKLVNNEGQIPDVPQNPRTIDPEEYETLKRSITEDPEFLGIREIVAYPIGGGYFSSA